MNVIIFALCVVVGVAIYAGLVRPIVNAVRRNSEAAKRRDLIERANVAAAKIAAEAKVKKYPDTRGGKLAGEREWRGA